MATARVTEGTANERPLRMVGATPGQEASLLGAAPPGTSPARSATGRLRLVPTAPSRAPLRWQTWPHLTSRQDANEAQGVAA